MMLWCCLALSTDWFLWPHFLSHRNCLTSRQTISDCRECISFRFFRHSRAQTHVFSIFWPCKVLFCDFLNMLPGSDQLGVVLVPLHAHEADHTGVYHWLGILHAALLTCTLTIMLCGLGLGWVDCRPLEAVDPGSHNWVIYKTHPHSNVSPECTHEQINSNFYTQLETTCHY
jgi:hypothetical protein